MPKPTLRTFRLVAITAALSLAAPHMATAQAYVFLQQWGVVDGSWAFNRPNGIDVDANGFVYVADPFAHVVQKFTNAGVFVRQFDSPGSFPAVNPFDVAVDVTGEVFVTDGASRVHVYSTGGSYLRTFPGSVPGAQSIAVDGLGFVYVSETYFSTTNVTQVQKFTRAGVVVATFGSYGSGPGQFLTINCVFADPAGFLYVVDNTSNVVQRLTTTGSYVGQWGSTGSGNGQFEGPSFLCLTPTGQVLVTDGDNDRVQIFTPTGTYLGQFGSTGGVGGKFSMPRGIVAAADGSLYTTEFDNQRVQKFGPGPVPTVATSWGRIKKLYR
jgi:streptogramin lyase